MEESTEEDERLSSHRFPKNPNYYPSEPLYPIQRAAKSLRCKRGNKQESRSVDGRHCRAISGLDQHVDTSSLSENMKKSRASYLIWESNSVSFGTKNVELSFEGNDSCKTQYDENEDLKCFHLLPRRPLAPSLGVYLQLNGARKFLPRPEWCRAPLHYSKGYAEEMLNGLKGFVKEREESRLNSKSLIKYEQNQINLSLQTVRNFPEIIDTAAPTNGLLPEQSFLGGSLVQKNISCQADPSFLSNRTLTTQNIKFAAPDRLQRLRDESDTRSVMNCLGDDNQVPSQHSSESKRFADPHYSASIFGNEQNSALHVAIRDDCTIAAIELIRHGAPVDYPNLKGVTPIIIASQKGNMEIVAELIKNGANPVAASLTGNTALIQASHFGHFDTVHYLLNHGAIANQSNYKSTTALMRSAQEGHEVCRIVSNTTWSFLLCYFSNYHTV